jgi:hypothetical protein
MNELINKKVKEIYGKQGKRKFCKKIGIPYATHGRLRKKFGRWITEINNYLSTLNLEIKIAEKIKVDYYDRLAQKIYELVDFNGFDIKEEHTDIEFGGLYLYFDIEIDTKTTIDPIVKLKSVQLYPNIDNDELLIDLAQPTLNNIEYKIQELLTNGK